MKVRNNIFRLLILCLFACLLVGCGSKKEKEEKEDVADVVKGSAEEMLKGMIEVERGTMSFSLKLNDGGNTKISADGEYVFDVEDRECSLDVSFDVGDGSKLGDVGEIFRVTDNKLYFNFGALKNPMETLFEKSGMSKDDMPKLSGWFMLPLPKDLPKQERSEQATAQLLKSLEGLFKDTPFEGVDGDYSLTARTKEDYTRIITAMRDYAKTEVKELYKNVPASEESLLKVDWNDYVAELIETYKDDLYDIVDEYGEEFGVTKKQLDAVLEEASKQDFNKMMKQYIEELDTVTEYSQEEIDSMVKDFTDGMNELLREVESMSDSEIPECVLRIAADDNGYIISLRAAMDISGKAAEASFELRLNPGSVSVKKPGDVTGLRGILDLVMPSYQKYVNKSQSSSDVSTLSEILQAAERIACDPEFDLGTGTKFVVDISDGAASLTISGNGDTTGAVDMWHQILWGDIDFRSSQMQKAEGTIVGTLDQDWNISWKVEDANASLKEVLEFSTDFQRKFNLK